MLLRAEAWTLPTSASFEKITDVPMLAGSSGSRELSSYSDNTVIVASTWDRFDDIRKSLIRIFDGDTVIDEHEVKRIAKSPRRPTQFQVSGPQANGLVEKLLIYPRTDSADAQDWIWGGENQLPPLGLGDLNNVNEEWSLWSDATSGTMTLTVDGQTTDTFAYNTSDPKSIENRIQALSNVNDVTVNGEGTEASPWTIIFYDPPDPTTVTVDDSGLSGGTATLTKEQEGGLDASPITQSQYADQRIEVAVHGSYGNPPIIPITQSNLDTGASWALQVNAEGQFAGSQLIVNVTPGQTYQAAIRVKPSVDGKYRLVIRDLFENEIKKTSPSEVSLTAGSYQDLTIPDVVIPPGVTEVIMRVAVVSSAPAEIDTFWCNWEAARFDEGMAATTFTEIVRVLLEDGQARGAYEFVDLDATDTTDTAGNVLSDESFTAFAFSNLGHVMADGSDLGYKWRIRPKATPVGALTHDLQIYLEGEVEDLTASSGGPTVQTGSVDDAAVVSRSPDFTVAVGWGAAGLYAEVEDTALVNDFGRIERVFDAEHLSSVASLERLLNEKFREQVDNEDALAATVPGDAQRVPLVDYAEGSKIWWAFPDEGVSKVAKTVRRVSWSHGNTASFTLQASEVLSEQAGMARAMHHLLRKFDRRRRRERRGTPILGGGKGDPSIVVAAAGASDVEKERADLVASGTDDHLTINTARDLLGGPGRIVLVGHQFNVAPDGIQLLDDQHLHGMGRRSTRIHKTAGAGSAVLGGSRSIVSNLQFTLAGASTGTIAVLAQGGGDPVIEDCEFNGYAEAVRVEDNRVTVRGCNQPSGTAFVSVEPSADYSGLQIIGNWAVGTIDLQDAESSLVANNVLQGAIRSTTARQLAIVGNVWLQLSSALDGAAISLTGGASLVAKPGVVVSGNIIRANYNIGVLADTVPGLLVASNTLINASIDIRSCTGAAVVGNQISNVFTGASIDVTSDDAVIHDNSITHETDGSDSTDDSIRVAADRVSVQDNRVVPSPHAGFETRYGVNVASGTDNVVLGNVLGVPADYGTDALNDAGTSTVLTFPGHATYGDNITF